MQFVFWLGLLVLEASLVVTYYILPQFQTQTYNPHPNIGFEMDTVLQEHPSLYVVMIGFLCVFVFGNIGLVVKVWRAFRNLRAEARDG
jgi:hypothetical protein